MAFKVPVASSSSGRTTQSEPRRKTRHANKLTLAEFDEKNADGFDPRNISTEVPKPWSEWRLNDDFEIGKPLGSGLMGHVYLARTKKEKMIVALKVIHAEEVEEMNHYQSIIRETEIHADISHEHIIQMYGFFRDGDKIVYVLEYAIGGEVFAELMAQEQKRFDDEKAATYVYQITLALEYLHAKGILHRDIKPENLLIGCYGEIKMADFGWSIQVKPHDNSRKSMCGTPDYLPPEMLLEQGYSYKVDIWSLGVLIYEFLVGTAPFLSDAPSDTQDKIGRVDFTIPDFVDEDAKDLIQKILVLNPDDRPSLIEIRSHPWCEKNRQKVKKLLPKFDSFAHLGPIIQKRYEKFEANRNLLKKQ